MVNTLTMMNNKICNINQLLNQNILVYKVYFIDNVLTSANRHLKIKVSRQKYFHNADLCNYHHVQGSKFVL